MHLPCTLRLHVTNRAFQREAATKLTSLWFVQLVQECVGYQASHGFFAVTFVLSGVLPVLAGIRPSLAVQLLILSPLHHADWVLVKVLI